MRAVISRSLTIGLAFAVFWVGEVSLAQDGNEKNPWPTIPSQPLGPWYADSLKSGSGLQQTGAECPPLQTACTDGSPGRCATGHEGCGGCAADAGFYAGAEFLLLRTHFSQAYAFAQVAQTQTPPIVRNVNAVVLPFDYDPSFRVFVGYSMGDNAGDFRFTYWHFRTDANKGEQVGSQAGVSEFVVDPLGAMAQTGDFITAHASVETNVYDLDFQLPILAGNCRWAITGSIGVRIADIDQKYSDPITTATGAAVTTGFFTASFVGAGPRLGLEARRYFGEAGRLSIFAKTSGSLLVGEYDFTAGAALPIFAANQSTHLTRTIPVAEMELGASWRPWRPLTLSAGWLFQAWFDLGASGGQFGGIYVPVDTANIMSFDGLVLRAELAF